MVYLFHQTKPGPALRATGGAPNDGCLKPLRRLFECAAIHAVALFDRAPSATPCAADSLSARHSARQPLHTWP